MVERMKAALRPYLHHGLANESDVEASAVRAVLTALREIDDPLSPILEAGRSTTGQWKSMIDAIRGAV
jgi:hypothetical protein